MVTSTNIFLLYFWLYVHLNSLQMDNPMGNIVIPNLLGSFNYRANDCSTSKNGINRGQTFMGPIKSIKTSIFVINGSNIMYPHNASIQTHHSIFPNAI